MITEDKVIEIFYMADEYSREFSKVRQKYSLDEGRNDGKRRRNKPNRMSDAEIMVILILFHTGGFRCFKHFYLEYVSRHMRHLFPVLSSYSRFVELEKEVALCLALFIKDVLLGKCTGIRASGQVHRHQLHGLDGTESVPHQAHALAPYFLRPGPERKDHHGMVLRLQAAPDHQRPGRNTQLHDHSPATPTTASRLGTSATCRTSGASSAETGAISARPFSRCSSCKR